VGRGLRKKRRMGAHGKITVKKTLRGGEVDTSLEGKVQKETVG